MPSSNPSKEYFNNLEYYKKMRSEGYRLTICICSIKENDKFEYFPLQYNDNLSNYSSK